MLYHILFHSLLEATHYLNLRPYSREEANLFSSEIESVDFFIYDT